MKAHINIGSNLGNSLQLIERAVAGIALLACGKGGLRMSSVVESEPWGYDSSSRFVNMGAEFETDLAAEELLSRLLEVQNSISSASHRNAAGGYVDREIDIDLIFLGDSVIPGGGEWIRVAGGEASECGVVVPHPRMHLRRFVLEPVAELSPQWRHPVLGLTASEMLEML